MATAKKCNTAAGAATMGLKLEAVPKTACVLCRFFDPTKIVKKGDVSLGCKAGEAGRYIWPESECKSFEAQVAEAKLRIVDEKVNPKACVTCKHFNPSLINCEGMRIPKCNSTKGHSCDHDKHIWSDCCCDDYEANVKAPAAPKGMTTAPRDHEVHAKACVRCKHFDPSKMRMGEADPSHIHGCKKTSKRQYIWTDSACDSFEAHHTPTVCAVGGIQIALPSGQTGSTDVLKKCKDCDQLLLWQVPFQYGGQTYDSQAFLCNANDKRPICPEFQDKCDKLNPYPKWMTHKGKPWGCMGDGVKGIAGDDCVRRELERYGCHKSGKTCKHIVLGRFDTFGDGKVSDDLIRVRCNCASPEGKESSSLKNQNCGGKYFEA